MKLFAVVVILTIMPFSAFAGCEGDFKGYFEKQALSGGDFETVKTFAIESASGKLSECEKDNSFDSNFKLNGDRMSFGYARRMRELSRSPNGSYMTPVWQTEHQGTTSNYRIRVEAD